ncbi:MAG: hypothetical protein ABSH04_02960, partial [Acidimicrobiales bacterium]
MSNDFVDDLVGGSGLGGGPAPSGAGRTGRSRDPAGTATRRQPKGDGEGAPVGAEFSGDAPAGERTAHSHSQRQGQSRNQGQSRSHSRSRSQGQSRGHGLVPPTLPEAVDIFDTTLRDGSQQEGLSLTVDDKLRVAEQLDHLGVAFVEGGWPGANPKDEEFFMRAPTELHMSTATLVAFGSTRRVGVRAEDDDVLRQLVKADTEAVCIVAKASELHVTEALRTTLEEALA